MPSVDIQHMSVSHALVHVQDFVLQAQSLFCHAKLNMNIQSILNILLKLDIGLLR
jgi:hypothetical protein